MLLEYNKGTALLAKGKYEKAVAELKKSISLSPTAEAYLNLGTCYKFLDKDSAASDCFRKALVTDQFGTDDIKAKAYTNLGLMSYVYDNDKEAIKNFDLALDNPDAQWNKATALLRQACSGDFSKFTEAWKLYDARFKKTPPVTLTGSFGALTEKIWCGEKDVRVLVACEQGLGDNIMFARYLPVLASMYNIKITLQGNSSLCSLLWSGDNVGSDIDPSKYDYIFPIGSICRFVGFIDPSPYIDFSEKFDLEGINIGVVWSGSRTHANDRHRSVSFQRFKRFAKYGNLWSLNVGAEVPPWINKCAISNWVDTAKWVNSMDLIISVDTSIVHLAGALGANCWMLQPYKETDFRWGSNNDSSNIWYSSVDVYRNPQSWDFVFDTLEEDLKNGITNG